MRKIEQQMVAAVRRVLESDVKVGRILKSGNTVVESHVVGRASVYLFGHLIATLDANQVNVTLAGYNTQTTRSRVNALLREFTSGYSVFSVASWPYYRAPDDGDDRRGHPFGDREWLCLPAAQAAKVAA